MFIDTYGTEAFSWSPVTICVEIHDDFGVELPGQNFDRLMAAIQILTTNNFYKSLPSFNDLCCILSGSAIIFDSFQPADAGDIAWGITEAVLLSGIPEEEEPFTPEIVGFIEEAVKAEGIITPPKILQLGQVGRDLADKIHVDYSDDPDMFSEIWQIEKSKTDEINSLVTDRLQAMTHQLEQLPLVNGSTEAISKLLKEHLQDYART